MVNTCLSFGCAALSAMCIKLLFLFFLVSSKFYISLSSVSPFLAVSELYFAAVGCRAEVWCDPPLTDFPLWPIFKAYSDKHYVLWHKAHCFILVRPLHWYQHDYEMGMTCKMFLCCNIPFLKVREVLKPSPVG